MYVKNGNIEIIQTVMRYYDSCKDMSRFAFIKAMYCQVFEKYLFFAESINETSIEALKAFLNDTGYPPVINTNWDPEIFDWLSTLALIQVKTGVSVLIRPQLATDYSNTSRFLMEVRS